MQCSQKLKTQDHATEAKKNRYLFIFLPFEGSPTDNEYDALSYGIRKIEEIDYEALSSAVDGAFVRDLLNSRSFVYVGKAENVIKDFLSD